jgi:hypothetical protein
MVAKRFCADREVPHHFSKAHFALRNHNFALKTLKNWKEKNV